MSTPPVCRAVDRAKKRTPSPRETASGQLATFVGLALITLAVPCHCAAEPLRLAVAANFQAAFAAVAADYADELAPTYGSSGLLYAQIVQGRAFDAFLSADAARPQALVTAGRAFAPVTYAVGRLVLHANAGKPGPDWLTADRRVAIANARTAPYGRAAGETLVALAAMPRRITAMNVAQAFHFAVSGAADGAFVALAQVVAKRVPTEHYWLVPEHLHTPIEQVAVVVLGGDEARARTFLRHLASDETQARIRALGYR